MIKGTVKFYNRVKGFGFITPDGGGPDVFVQAASLAAAQISTLTIGQQVAFEIQVDKKGPKATNLSVEQSRSPEDLHRPKTVTVYCDPRLDESIEVLAALNGNGANLQIIDYTASPPTPDQLKRLSRLLQDSQNLVHRYHPLFSELQLNDRFLGEGEFWTAVAEHPQLINGPVLTNGSKARICKTAANVQAFFGPDEGYSKAAKAMSPRILAMITGKSVDAYVPQSTNDAKELKEVLSLPPTRGHKKPSARKKSKVAKSSKAKPRAKPARPAQKKKPPARQKKK